MSRFEFCDFGKVLIPVGTWARHLVYGDRRDMTGEFISHRNRHNENPYLATATDAFRRAGLAIVSA